MSFFSEGFMGLALLGKNAKDSGKGKGPTQTGCMVIIALMLAFTLSVAWMVQRYYPAKNNARIEGRVVTLNGEPLKDAVIESEGERVSTNINGHFTIVLPNRGQQVDLKVTHNAYRNVKHHFVNLADGSPPAIQITMGTADSYSGPSPSPVSTSPPPSNTPPSGVSGGGSSNTPPPVYEKNYHLEVDERYDAFVKKREDLAGVGEYLLDLEVLSTSGEPLFSGVWSRTVSPDKMWLDDPGAFDRKNGEFQRDGFNLVDIEPYKVKGVTRYAGLWRAGVTSDAVYTMDLTWEGLLSLRTQRQGNGYHLADLEAIEVNNEVRYIGLWHKRKAQAKIWKASSPDEVTRKNTEFEREGFSLSDIEIILESGKLRYLMIWQQGVMNTRLVLGANESVFAQKQLEMTSQGMILSDFEEDIIQGKKGMTGIWTAGSATLTAPVLDDGGLRILE